MSTSAIAKVPKAELHLHIEGTLEPQMVFDLAKRNGIELPFDSVDALSTAYKFEDLGSFLSLYYDCMAVLRTKQDYEDLCVAYLEHAVADGVRHVEMFFDPQAHSSRGIGIDIVIEGLTAGLNRFSAQHDLSGGLILCFLRDQPVEDALATLESAIPYLDHIIGVGLDSAEAGYPPSLFVDVFARAAELGLHRVAHAGEEGPAEYITQALDLLGAERIDHGVRCLEDPAVVETLRDRAIPITVCPFSNVMLGGVASIAHHPLPRLIGAGLVVTINSDDPAYFGGYVADNYEAVATAFDLSRSDLASLARNSVASSFASSPRKGQLMNEIECWVANDS